MSSEQLRLTVCSDLSAGSWLPQLEFLGVNVSRRKDAGPLRRRLINGHGEERRFTYYRLNSTPKPGMPASYLIQVMSQEPNWIYIRVCYGSATPVVLAWMDLVVRRGWRVIRGWLSGREAFSCGFMILWRERRALARQNNRFKQDFTDLFLSARQD
ncbi:hypothetical protein TgHK011_008568 [Trichoderma gracile]|nr:hypothetical protein TgHK011_008568 [Trichoderma gracile]